MSDETPQVVNLPASADLDTFLSEFPSEGHEGPSVVALDGAPSLEHFAATDAEARSRPDSTATGPEVPESVVAMQPPIEPRPVAKAATASKPATITEFPVYATRPPTPAPSTTALAPSSITLVELLERQGGLEWRRAVAVIHQICGLLKQQPPHQPILLDPRNILITQDGQVRLLPALSSGDPLVIQLGRLLRAMLTGNDAPPELRLLLAQATFELPIFESVEDVERALVQLERLEPKSGDPAAFSNPIVPPQVADIPPPEAARRAGRSILPKPQASERRGSQRRASLIGGLYLYGLRIAIVALIAVGLAALITIKPSLLWPSFAPAAKTTATTPSTVASTSPTATEPTVEAPTTAQPAPPVSTDANARVPVTIPAPPLVPVDRPRGREQTRTANNRTSTADAPASTAGTAAESPAPRSTVARSAAPPPATPAVSPRESERRAASLIAQGQTAQAGIVFDALLLSNPLYEPEPSSLTPEALDAFRASQRTLLPNIAQKNFERARAALAAGDAERALALSREVGAILDRRIAEPPAQFREQVDDLISAASAAKSQADEIVYTTADKGVVPPRELSRQFPASNPLGIPPHRVGTLEMIIDKDGGVEFVKLHTPLNRYHERMIVSAAKAWRYRPATRNGKPVKYRLTVRINLPESGTDF
jgi:hypothetical protein